MKNRALVILQLVLLVTFIVSLAAPATDFARRTFSQWQSRSTWKELNNSTSISGGDPIAWLRIPDVSIDSMVLLDASKTNLAELPCLHVSSLSESTPMLVMAHRDTHFRKLRNLTKGAAITWESRNGEIRNYVVSDSEVISPEDVSLVLAKTDPDSVVLMTCWPFDYIGPAPKRILFRTKRIH